MKLQLVLYTCERLCKSNGRLVVNQKPLSD